MTNAATSDSAGRDSGDDAKCSAIIDLLRSRAEQTPNADAVLAPNRRCLSYSGLYEHVKYVAQTLRECGLNRNDRVAVVLANGPEMATAFIAASTVATCAPLNPAYRESEFDFYLSDLGAKAIIVGQGAESPARAVATARGIAIFELSPQPEAEAGLFTLSPTARSKRAGSDFTERDDIALVLHTSGTTSRPKLVPLTQANLCASARNTCRSLGLNARDRCLNVMPLFHIHGLIGATLASLAAGASVVCTPGFDAGQFFAWLHEFRPTWYTAVPTMHQAILGQAASNASILARSSLRLIRSSSASLPPTVMHELEQTFGVPVVEAYGMTEASHQVCSNPLPPFRQKPGSVGLPAGPDVAIVDATGNQVPAGVDGEIVIRGSNVTAGYENNAAANPAAFVDGWFRTGDLGRIDPDGYVLITGRTKEIINRGGEKISPREVDEALMSHPAVVQAVAFAVPHETLGEDLAAAVVLADHAQLTEQSLREYAFQHLADFKVPSRIVFVNDIPKGPTGKLQRIGLHKQLEGHLKTAYQPPRTELESLVVRLVAEVLHVERVGVGDNFFALGGDSLRATQLVSRVRAECQVEFPISDVFRKPTPESLAIEIGLLLGKKESGSIDDILKEVEQLSEEDARRLLADL